MSKDANRSIGKSEWPFFGDTATIFNSIFSNNHGYFTHVLKSLIASPMHSQHWTVHDKISLYNVTQRISCHAIETKMGKTDTDYKRRP